MVNLRNCYQFIKYIKFFPIKNVLERVQSKGNVACGYVIILYACRIQNYCCQPSLIVATVQTSSDIIKHTTHITGNSSQLIVSNATSSELLLQCKFIESYCILLFVCDVNASEVGYRCFQFAGKLLQFTGFLLKYQFKSYTQ